MPTDGCFISNSKGGEEYSITHKTNFKPDQKLFLTLSTQSKHKMSIMNLVITTLLLVSRFDFAESRLQLLRVDVSDHRVAVMESQRRLDDAMANVDSTYTPFSHVMGNMDGSMSMLDFSFSMKSTASSPTWMPVVTTVTVTSSPSALPTLPSSMPSFQNTIMTSSSSNPFAGPVLVSNADSANSSSPAAASPAVPPPTSSPTSNNDVSAVSGSNNSHSSDTTKQQSSVVASTVIVAVAGMIGLALFVLRRSQVFRNHSGSDSVASNDFSIA
jgi:hypothetical protein